MKADRLDPELHDEALRLRDEKHHLAAGLAREGLQAQVQRAAAFGVLARLRSAFDQAQKFVENPDAAGVAGQFAAALEHVVSAAAVMVDVVRALDAESGVRDVAYDAFGRRVSVLDGRVVVDREG